MNSNAARRLRYAEDPDYRAHLAEQRHASYLRHKEERKAYIKQWKQDNPDKVKASRAAYHQRSRANGVYRAGHIRRKYGLTPDEEQELWERQGGCCAICGRPLSGPGKPDTHLDHDHATKVVRGFLCIRCNHAIGSFADEPALLEVAIAYLG